MIRHQLRGLTLHRPWAEAFCLPEQFGPKRVENRTWFPQWPHQCRGMGPMRHGIALVDPHLPLIVALHAGKELDGGALAYLTDELGLPIKLAKPGTVVALERLHRVLDVAELTAAHHPEIFRHKPWIIGPFAWELDHVTVLPEPIPHLGQQGLWPGILAIIPELQPHLKAFLLTLEGELEEASEALRLTREEEVARADAPH
jgi:hypothetical protein